MGLLGNYFMLSLKRQEISQFDPSVACRKLNLPGVMTNFMAKYSSLNVPPANLIALMIH